MNGAARISENQPAAPRPALARRGPCFAASAGHAPASPMIPSAGAPAASGQADAGAREQGDRDHRERDQHQRRPACPVASAARRQTRCQREPAETRHRAGPPPPPGAPRSAARVSRSRSRARRARRSPARPPARRALAPATEAPAARGRLVAGVGRRVRGAAQARADAPGSGWRRHRLGDDARASLNSSSEARSARWNSSIVPALARLRAQRQVDPASELARQVATLASQRRQMRAEPAGALSGASRP